MASIKSIETFKGEYVHLQRIVRSDDHVREVVKVPDSVAFLVYNEETCQLIFVSQVREAMLIRGDMGDGSILEVPAGHINHGESVQAAVVRELWEELRIRITEDMVDVLINKKPVALSPGVLTEMMYFAIVRITSKNIIEEREVYGVTEEGESITKVVFDHNEVPADISDLKTAFLISIFFMLYPELDT